MFGLEPLFDELQHSGQADWGRQLRMHADAILNVANHGNMPRWVSALESLPKLKATDANFNAPVVTFGGEHTEAEHRDIRNALRAFHPWRKGPFELFGVKLDAEWRSDLKWTRVAPHVDLRDKDVLDVGCGNGYYGWRMIGAGAKRVIGLEPYALYNMQHAVFKRYAPKVPNFVVPGSDQHLPEHLKLFDVAFSMGVLYHCRNPFGHLVGLRNSLKSGGECVLETLVIEGDDTTMLIPQDRYAKMRNVWFIPSTQLLTRMLARTGFTEISTVDVTVTTIAEQRTTEWMSFESLSDFLDPSDGSRTIEGYPAPRRAIVTARLKKMD